jgi:predicted transcriptional regulator
MAKGRRAPKDKLKLQDTVRLSADGLSKVLGDLEARVMEAMWALGKPASARTVHERVARRHPVAQLTVVTVLNKLVAKRLLSRAKRDDLLHYRPTLSRDEFMTRVSRRIAEGILSLGPSAIAASMVDVLAEQDRETLERLAKLVSDRLRAEED